MSATRAPSQTDITAPARILAQGPPAGGVVRIAHSPDAGVRDLALALDGRRFVVGRTADVAVDDARLSRAHVSLEPAPAASGAYVLRDLGSRNGCFVNGRCVSESLLSHDDVVRVGDTLLVVDVPGRFDDLPARGDAAADLAQEWVGISHLAFAVRRTLATVAGAVGPVLVTGPTGAGKEVFAQAVHRLSGRRGAFVPVNCAAIPSELVESELFGFVRGAFSGAVGARSGLVRQADQGTLFLDEVGDMPPLQQTRLLRVLEEGRVRPVGSDTGVPVDLRVVAATHVDLLEQGSGFRNDLYGRLAEWVVRLPALRERRSDVLTLARHFAEERFGRRPELTAELAESLLLHDWPLNVRELRRLVGRMGELAPGGAPWDVGLLPGAMRRSTTNSEPPGAPLPDRHTLERLLHESKGNVAEVGRQLDRDRTQVYRWMKRYGLTVEQFRGDP